jgi:hypothetical protein
VGSGAVLSISTTSLPEPPQRGGAGRRLNPA